MPWDVNVNAAGQTSAPRLPIHLPAHEVALVPFRLACVIGLADSLTALVTAIATRPQTTSIVFGAFWVCAWASALILARPASAFAARRPLALPLLAAVGMLPALLDGGYPGTLATQPVWIVIVAAVVAPWPVTVATGVAATAAKALVFEATGTLVIARGEVLSAVGLPLLLVPLSLALKWAVGRVLALFDPASPPAPEPAASGPGRRPLSPAEREITEMLAAGLVPKEVAAARGTSLATVRTQIKHAKRATGARTLEELVTTAGREP
ncbi:MAG: helix-turn-helix transcriptional regulator [Actinobacteria bacterium]|nr:helix-turn-helix transcriptional regulator [Actinomycetota bacterium]